MSKPCEGDYYLKEIRYNNVNAKKTYFEVPHKEGKITFQYPAFQGFYGEVAEQIDKENLQRPTSAETASLVYYAFQNQEGKYEKEIISCLEHRWLWEFTGNLYIPKSDEKINKGVILDNNPEITGNMLKLDKDSLIKRLQENDSLVKFVPFGYNIGEQSTFKLKNNPYIVARYGKEGAKKIAKVASNFHIKPTLWSEKNVISEFSRMSALGHNWGLGNRLIVAGGYSGLGSFGVGRAFGIVKQ